MLKKSVLILLPLLLISCSKQKFEDTKLLLKLEHRNFAEDIITEYQIFENALIQETITHNTKEEDKVFRTRYKEFSAEQKSEFNKYFQEFRDLDYHNSFPWKEDFTKRSDVYRFIFLKPIKTNALDSKNSVTVLVPQTYHYYSGLQKEKILEELIKLITKEAEKPVKANPKAHSLQD